MTPDKQPKARILLVDDDPIILDSLGGFLGLEGYEVMTANSAAQARDRLEASVFDLIISDVSMPNEDGFDLLRHVRARFPEVVLVMITGYGTIETAVEAIKQGAYDYLTKPVIDDDVRLAVQRALTQRQLLAENRRLKEAMARQQGFIPDDDFQTQEMCMVKILRTIEALSDGRTTVLITGESGTGKSLLARYIHAKSTRAKGPFVEVSCGALPDTLLESELFGHVRGAFTGAMADKIGKFQAADGGTIFLDEISSASPGLQVKLLRVLQERKFEPVGSNRTREVDVRVVLATNHDLAAMVKEGKFRQDLFYRINVVHIEVPPLRERIWDIAMLARHFLAKYDPRGRIANGISETAEVLMRRYDWPGNVRELENCMERAIVLCRTKEILPEDLPASVFSPPQAVRKTRQVYKLQSPTPGASLENALAEPEKEIIRQALEDNRGSRKFAAAQLGINRCTLYKKMKKYGLFEGTA